MRLVLMGTPDFAVPSLRRLVADGFDVALVVTQPDRPVGRHREPAPPPVKVAAQELGLPVSQPETMREPAAVESIRGLTPDVIVVVAYGQMLRRSVLRSPRLGCVNVHPSLLPRFRGAAPIPAAILGGCAVTGVTIMLIGERMDAGPILTQRVVAIRPDDTTRTLSQRLAEVGADLLVATLPRLADGSITPEPQREEDATYCRPLTREDGWIDWTQPAEMIARQVRAYDPWPGTATRFRGELLKVLAAEPQPSLAAAPPGTILAVDQTQRPATLVVATGEGTLRITRVQLAGRRPVGADEFARGQRDLVGVVLVRPAGT
ncbi:MAG: methionyl-tRNA formyltransferase [Chloroflexi bacterium]|nr:methionyl-tRNA formyltransferase [Chloroflexota bacterium]